MMCLDTECLFFVLSISNPCRIFWLYFFFFILCMLVLLLMTHFSFCSLPLNRLKEWTHTCSLIFLFYFLYAGVCSFPRLQVSLVDREMRKIYPLLLFLAPPLRKCWRELAILQSALYDVTNRTDLPLGSPFKRWGCILMFSKDLKGFRGSLFVSLEKTTSQSQLKLGIPYRVSLTKATTQTMFN